jgi:tRNA (guanine37-N1)-methyltransferase
LSIIFTSFKRLCGVKDILEVKFNVLIENIYIFSFSFLLMKQRAFNVLGNVALVNFPFGTKESGKKKFAKELLIKHNNIKTVLEKSHNFSGRLRKQTTKYLGGVKTKEVLYKENGCEFRFNLDETYFSPRLANERKEISDLMKKGEEILVMFAGVSPFPIVIAKNSGVKKIYSNELNRKANEYGEENIVRNKLQDKIELFPGDIKKVALKFREAGKTFDVIVMPRPQLKDSFLDLAFMLSRPKTRIYYYDFCKIEDKEKIVEKIKKEAKEFGVGVRINKVKDAGEIAPYKVRLRVDFEIVGKKGFFGRLFGFFHSS